MKIFIDSADTNEIKYINDTGLIDGVTTNPSLIAKSGLNFIDAIEQICKIIDGPVSAEVTATDADTMILEGKKLSKIASNVVIKVPLTVDGLKACKSFSNDNIKVNVTLIFSVSQAILSAKAGARYISPFVGRVDDNSFGGLCLIKDIANIYEKQNWKSTEILAASIRDVRSVGRAFEYGANICTLPPVVFRKMYKHILTDKGIELFENDWKSVQLSEA